MTERLKSQSAVSTSLTQALFSALNSSIKKDMFDTGERLHRLVSKARTLESLLGEALGDHHLDRITLYMVCFLTLLVCFLTVTIVRLMLYSILTKVNQVMNLLENASNIRVGENELLRPNNITISPPLTNVPNFQFSDTMAPPPALKALSQQR